MGPDDEAVNAAHCQMLVQLLGIREAEASDPSLNGRIALIGRLKAARRTEIARGRKGSWLYDINRHLNLCAALRTEYRLICKSLAIASGDSSELEPGPGVILTTEKGSSSRPHI